MYQMHKELISFILSLIILSLSSVPALVETNACTIDSTRELISKYFNEHILIVS